MWAKATWARWACMLAWAWQKAPWMTALTRMQTGRFELG